MLADILLNPGVAALIALWAAATVWPGYPASGSRIACSATAAFPALAMTAVASSTPASGLLLPPRAASTHALTATAALTPVATRTLLPVALFAAVAFMRVHGTRSRTPQIGAVGTLPTPGLPFGAKFSPSWWPLIPASSLPERLLVVILTVLPADALAPVVLVVALIAVLSDALTAELSLGAITIASKLALPFAAGPTAIVSSVLNPGVSAAESLAVASRITRAALVALVPVHAAALTTLMIVVCHFEGTPFLTCGVAIFRSHRHRPPSLTVARGVPWRPAGVAGADLAVACRNWKSLRENCCTRCAQRRTKAWSDRLRMGYRGWHLGRQQEAAPAAEAAVAERTGRVPGVSESRGKRPGARGRRAFARSAQAGIYPARDHDLFRLYRHQYPPHDLTQFLPRRDRHGWRPQRLPHRHPRGPWLPAHLRRGASVAAWPGPGHGHRPHRRRDRVLPLCRSSHLRRVDHPDAHRQRRLPLLAPAPGRARSLVSQAGRGGERAGTLPLYRICRHHRRAAGDAGNPLLRGSNVRRSSRGAGAMVTRSLRGDRGLRLRRRGGHLPLSRLRQRPCRGPRRATYHLAQGIQPLLLAELSRRLAHADLFRLRALC